MNKICAGDVILHKPSGETWLVCGVNHELGKLVACGYPFPTIGLLSDCELVEKGNGQSDGMKDVLRQEGLLSYIEENT